MPQPPNDAGSAGHGASRLSQQDLETILAVTRALAEPFELDPLLAEVARAACSVMRAERASVWLLDAAAQQLFIEVSSDLQQTRVPVGTGLVGRCAASRAPINVPDCYADPRFNAEVDRRSGFHTRCSLSVPLVDHDHTLVGVLQILNKHDGVFDTGDEALASALAAQCAVALARVRMTASVMAAERLRQELELARVVQLSTLPTAMPDLPGYAMHGTFLPAQQTGGDTYDLALTEHGLLVVLADATGHGIAPALTVTQMHAMLRMALRMGADLDAAFRHVNDQLAATLPDGRFVAACIGLLDPLRHRLRLLSGGQAPILHFQAARGECSSHRATSFPMGAAVLSQPKPAIELTLAPGDLLVLITDGVFEYEAPGGEQFGKARLEALLRAHHTDTPASLADRILTAVQVFARGAPQEDDITMVLLKRLPHG